MRINYNAAAMRANNSLNVANNKVSESLKKLSSGFKVNSAKDNPSGYAIGRRMNTQIEGVSVATQNANTGISVIETAEGALTEVHDMLQRMNELAIKGATGTLTTSDRAIVNEELQQLKKEVTRIAEDTEFNGQPLLNGCFDLKGYTNNLDVKVGYYSDEVLSKVYTIDNLEVFYLEDGKIDLDKTKASFVPGDGFPDGVEITAVGENCVTIKGDNNFEITIDIDKERADEQIENSKQAREGFQLISPVGDSVVDTYVIDSLNYSYDDLGDLNEVNIKLGDNFPEDSQIEVNGNIVTITSPSDPDFKLEFSVPATSDPNAAFDIRSSIIMDFTGDEDVLTFTNTGAASYTNLELDITGIGAMTTQIGANEGQVLDIRIPTISLQRLGLTNCNLLTQDSSSDAIVAIKGAIAYTSSVRSRLGAYQNRLEHTISSLDITNENMTGAYSRIMDVDMAEEMTTYTSQQVVEQAAVSILAQANERPSQVLQLLQ